MFDYKPNLDYLLLPQNMNFLLGRLYYIGSLNFCSIQKCSGFTKLIDFHPKLSNGTMSLPFQFFDIGHIQVAVHPPHIHISR